MKTKFFNIGLTENALVFEESYLNGRFCAVFNDDGLAIELIDCTKIDRDKLKELTILAVN